MSNLMNYTCPYCNNRPEYKFKCLHCHPRESKMRFLKDYEVYIKKHFSSPGNICVGEENYGRLIKHKKAFKDKYHNMYSIALFDIKFWIHNFEEFPGECLLESDIGDPNGIRISIENLERLLQNDNF